MKHEKIQIASLLRKQMLLQQELDTGQRVERVQNMAHHWQRIEQIQSLVVRATRRGYDGAMRRLLAQTRQLIPDLRLSAESAHYALQKPRHPVPSLRSLVDEIDAIEHEFGRYRYSHQPQILSVTTSSIELEGQYLGPFEIQLEIPCLRNHLAQSFYRCVALDPQPATASEQVTHPHVSDDLLCAGDATTSIHAAVTQGRLCDFFVLVKQVLNTYNPQSPYIALDHWHGMSCTDCGAVLHEEDLYVCPRCGESCCEDCSAFCRHCGEMRCLQCATRCPFCEDVQCRSCLKVCIACGETCCSDCLEEELCPTCFEKKEEDHEETQETCPTST